MKLLGVCCLLLAIAVSQETGFSQGIFIDEAPSLGKRTSFSASEINGKIYIIGGVDTLSAKTATVEEYDIANDTWTLKSPMPTAWSGLVTVVIAGKIYAIGGMTAIDITSVVEVYDPGADT